MANRHIPDLVVVTGAGGFIGGHLIADLRRQGYRRLWAVVGCDRSRWRRPARSGMRQTYEWIRAEMVGESRKVFV